MIEHSLFCDRVHYCTSSRFSRDLRSLSRTNTSWRCSRILMGFLWGRCSSPQQRSSRRAPAPAAPGPPSVLNSHSELDLPAGKRHPYAAEVRSWRAVDVEIVDQRRILRVGHIEGFGDCGYADAADIESLLEAHVH